MIVLGLDPGLRNYGYAVLSGTRRSFTLVDAGAITGTKNKALPNKAEERHAAMYPIVALLDSLFMRFEVDLVAIESLILGGAGGVVAAVSSGYAAGATAACVRFKAPLADRMFIAPRDWRRELLGVQGGESEDAAHEHVDYMLDGMGGDLLGTLPAKQRGHARDAAGLAIVALRRER